MNLAAIDFGCSLVGCICNGEKMWFLVLPSLSGVCLDQSRVVEVVHAIKWIGRNKHDTGVCVNFSLCISKLNGL